MSRMDSLDHEEVDVCTKTNYAGYVYWGEYSLCFAAVLNQEECFRLILSRGINLDKSRLVQTSLYIIAVLFFKKSSRKSIISDFPYSTSIWHTLNS